MHICLVEEEIWTLFLNSDLTELREENEEYFRECICITVTGSEPYKWKDQDL